MNYTWDARMIATLAILAKATPGQGNILKDLLVDVVRARVQGDGSQMCVPTEKDILDIIKVIYERAGSIAQQVSIRKYLLKSDRTNRQQPTAKEKAKLKEQERRRRQRANKRQAVRRRRKKTRRKRWDLRLLRLSTQARARARWWPPMLTSSPTSSRTSPPHSRLGAVPWSIPTRMRRSNNLTILSTLG